MLLAVGVAKILRSTAPAPARDIQFFAQIMFFSHKKTRNQYVHIPYVASKNVI
jgi:hypothetical protein